ncbi:hypothetical protein F7725_027685, partial [Dissostichus mawsoni]
MMMMCWLFAFSSGDIPVPLKTDAERSVPPHTVGADITDYFNYGFDEEIWKMYCKKQAEVHAANGKLYLVSEVSKALAGSVFHTYLYRRGPPALSSLDRGHSKGFDDPFTSKPCSSGVSYLIPRNMTLKAGVRETAKAWEFILRQEESENSRERSRKRGLAKGRRRVRDKNRGKCSSSH